jgi:hypothetical protein
MDHENDNPGIPPQRVSVHGPNAEIWEGFCHLRHLPPRRYQLRLIYDNAVFEAEEWDYFEALCKIRLQLEARGHIVACYGAARNVFPSGMARDMGAGLKAYRCHLGKAAQMADLVSIFESGPDLEVASVEEQHAFHQKWVASLSIQGQK